MSLIKLINVNKIFQLSDDMTFQALKDINLEIKKGEFVSIVGASGSGKSTLMNILGLLDKPTDGKYLLENNDVSKLDENQQAAIRNKKIGFIFQSFNLLNRTTALDNVALPLIYSGFSKQARLVAAEKALGEVGLSEKLNSRPNQLSGGQQQRVAIARALVTNPEVILADEPTGNLDSKTGHEIMELLGEFYKKGKTIVLITHDTKVAQYGKRIITIQDGEIV